MTVVARLAINGYPMLIGDLLLSVEDPTAASTSVPTADNLSVLFLPGSSRVPCGLRQKIAVVAGAVAPSPEETTGFGLFEGGSAMNSAS